MSLVATVEALVSAGATGEMILAVVRAHEAQRELRAIERREKDAARKKAQRVRDGHAESRGHCVTSRDSAGTSPHVGAGAQVVNPSLPSLRSEEVVGGGVVGRERDPQPDDWPDGRASDHAEQLVALVASPWLDPSKSPDLVTTRGRVAAWKRDGASWEHDVLPVVTGLCANRRGRISSWKFFDAAIARSIAENRAALEIPEAGSVIPFRNTGPPRTIDEKSSAVWDEMERRFSEDGQ